MKGKWRPIGKRHAISLIGINETLLGGQSFAWTAESENQWVGVIRKAVVQLRWIDGQLEWRSSGIMPMSEAGLLDYLWLDESYDLAVDQLPWRSDQPLHRAVKHFPGLRILRQPIDETLLVFLLSSAKSIPQIKKLREKIHLLFGQSLDGNLYAFPGWNRLKKLASRKPENWELAIGQNILLELQISCPKQKFSRRNQKIILSEAKLKLMELPGVGPKVADCILLFGGEKSEAFPIDTWVLQSMEKQYGMKGWKISQMEEFARIHFGLHAGLAQQFLFSYQRNFGKKIDSKSTKI